MTPKIFLCQAIMETPLGRVESTDGATIAAYICPSCDDVHLTIAFAPTIGTKIQLSPDEAIGLGQALINPPTREALRAEAKRQTGESK